MSQAATVNQQKFSDPLPSKSLKLQEWLQELLHWLQEWLQETYIVALKVLYNKGFGGLIS